MRAHNSSKQKKCSRKKSKPAALTRSTKRGKKKKKSRASDSATEMEMTEVEIKTEPLLVEEEEVVACGMNEIMLHSSPSSHHPSEVYLTDADPLSQQVEVQVQLEGSLKLYGLISLDTVIYLELNFINTFLGLKCSFIHFLCSPFILLQSYQINPPLSENRKPLKCSILLYFC